MTSEAKSTFDRFVSRYQKKNFFFNAIKKREINTIDQILCPYQQVNTTVLDVGCGVGDYIPILLQYFSFIHGLDNSQKMLQQAPSFPNVTYINSDLLEVPTKKKYEFITCFGVLEFNSNIDIFVNKIRNLSMKGSYIALMAPRANFATFLYRLFHQMQGVRPYYHSPEAILYTFGQFTKLISVTRIGPLNSLYVFQVH